MLMDLLLLAAGTMGVNALGGWAVCRVRRSLRLFRVEQNYSTASLLEDLPSVSVCIPARNERHAMTQCLERVLASTYPKLEVIVCDDSSVDGTSSLIKAFARDGVRFVEGTKPARGWLGKNNALNSLLGEASGTYVLFLDVDTYLSPSSISQMVAYAHASNAAMISVLPVRRDTLRASVVLAPLRYFWRVLIHTKKHPVAVSSAWMVNRKRFLATYGDFSSLKAAIEPEVEAAKTFSAQQAYRFLSSYQLLGVSYEKKLSSQIETSIRLRFPWVGSSLLKSLAFVAILAGCLFLPLCALLSSVIWLQWLGMSAYLLQFAAYYAYLKVVWKRHAIFGALLLPFILLLDIYIIVRSFWQYRTNNVTWKGRNVSSVEQAT